MAYKLLFAGTPEHAAVVLKALAGSKHEVVGVYTQADKPTGRGRKYLPSPVKVMAESLSLPVEQPLSLKTVEAQDRFREFNADLMIVFAYGLILPAEVLAIPKFGCLNIHTSLLPRWRGAAPVQRAIMAGDAQTGVSIMQMDEGLDTGPVLATKVCPIYAADTTGDVLSHMTDLSIPVLLQILDDLPGALANKKIQNNDEACYASKISKEDARINWSLPAVEIERNIRGLSPAPIAHAFLGELSIKIHSATLSNFISDQSPGTILETSAQGIMVQTGEGAIAITRAQLPGGKPLAVKDLLNRNHHPFVVGVEFT